MAQNLIIPTAEPFFLPGGKVGVLLVHGFTGTPKEMRWMGEDLNNNGYSVLGIRLAGHATTPEDLARTRWQDWLASVEDGLNFLRGCTRQQFVMGLSLGGVLSLLAATRYPVAGVMAISTPYGLPDDPRIHIMGVMAFLKPKMEKGDDDFHNADAEAVHVALPYTPSRSMMEVVKAIRVLQAELPTVKVPALLVQSRLDKVVPSNSLDGLFDHIGSTDKTRMWVENSGHVVTEEPDREEVFRAASGFVKRVSTAS